MRSIFLTALLLLGVAATVDRQALDWTIAKAQENAWKELRDDNWCFPTYLGTWFMSEYYFEIKAMNLTDSQFNQTFFIQKLLDT